MAAVTHMSCWLLLILLGLASFPARFQVGCWRARQYSLSLACPGSRHIRQPRVAASFRVPDAPALAVRSFTQRVRLERAGQGAMSEGPKRLSLIFITRVAPHCVNTLMILHAAHTLMISAG